MLAQRGADVGGLDALLGFIDDPAETAIDAFAISTAEANLVGFLAPNSGRLIGWAVVPSDLPPLPSS